VCNKEVIFNNLTDKLERGVNKKRKQKREKKSARAKKTRRSCVVATRVLQRLQMVVRQLSVRVQQVPGELGVVELVAERTELGTDELARVDDLDHLVVARDELGLAVGVGVGAARDLREERVEREVASGQAFAASLELRPDVLSLGRVAVRADDAAVGADVLERALERRRLEQVGLMDDEARVVDAGDVRAHELIRLAVVRALQLIVLADRAVGFRVRVEDGRSEQEREGVVREAQHEKR